MTTTTDTPTSLVGAQQPLVHDSEPLIRRARRAGTAAFTPPELPPASNRAFRFHMAYTLLDAVFAGIMGNTPLMAVKALHATDAQLQLPLAMTSIGLFASVLTGTMMSKRAKKPFVLVPGVAMALSAILMSWTDSALWFLAAAGMVSIFDFALRPAVPSILRIVYPDRRRSHVAGTLRQYASIVFLLSTVGFASLLQASGEHIRLMIQIQLTLAGLASLTAFWCFGQLPNLGDGSADEANPSAPGSALPWYREYARATFSPFRDPRFQRFLAIFLLYACGNLFYMGIVPAFFGRDLGYGYVQATLFIHVIPAVSGFLGGGRLTSWFDRTTIWRSYGVVALLWGSDPVLLALMPFAWPVLALARTLRGPATVGSIVLACSTGVHSFTRPGPDTSCYMGTLFFVNGLARFIAPTAAALLAGHMSHRLILLCGGLCVLGASALFLRSDGRVESAT